MSVSIVRGTNDKPVSSQELVRLFAGNPNLSGHLFVGYPIIGTSEGRHPIDALLISANKGIVIFDLIEGADPGDYGLRQDDSANKIEARLKTHRELMRRRDLLVPIHTISFAPGLREVRTYLRDGYLLANRDTLIRALEHFEWNDSNGTVYKSALSAIQSISTIRKSLTKRTVTREDSRGSKLKRLEDSIATLDNLQSKAVLETVDGVQRIRGLAGSGKTIVLALKAAYLHAQHPEWRIAVTFNTRSLKGTFRRLINNFSLEQTGEEPDWDNLRIVNAWGAPGVVSETASITSSVVRTISSISTFDQRGVFWVGKGVRWSVRTGYQSDAGARSIYDAVLVDEAQDFPPAFLRLCYELLGDTNGWFTPMTSCRTSPVTGYLRSRRSLGRR